MNFNTFIVIWMLINIVVTISMVGRRRTPLTPGAAAIATLINLGVIAWALSDAGVLGG